MPRVTGDVRYEESAWSISWLQRRAELSPSRPAIDFADVRLDYRELAERASRAAASLRGLGYRQGDVIATLLPSELAIVELIHAAQVLGVTLVLLNNRLSAQEIAHQLDDAGARLLIHGSGPLAELATSAARGSPDLRLVGIMERCSIADGRAGPALEDSLLRRPIELGRPLVILYTSGTSGRPKGVPLSSANLLASAAGSASLLGDAILERWLLCLPVFHVGGLSVLMRSVLAGAEVVLHPRFEPECVERDLVDRRITGISLVANMLDRVLRVRAERAASETAPGALRCVLLGGGPAPDALIERACEAGFPIAPTYGLTEASSQVATRPPDESGEAGLRPLPGMQIRVLDRYGDEVDPGVEGEVAIRGPAVMAGYWGHPEAGAAVTDDGWFGTGDIGVLDRGGGLRILDRRSDLIVSGGENVYPAEVEAALLVHAAVLEAGVAGVVDDEFGARPVAWLVLEDSSNLDAEALRRHCEARLARYKIPIRFHFVRALPRTSSGKLMRRGLVEGDTSRD